MCFSRASAVIAFQARAGTGPSSAARRTRELTPMMVIANRQHMGLYSHDSTSLRNKFQPRPTADSVRKYLAWATREDKVEHHSADTARVILDQDETTVSAELDQLDYRLQELTQYSGIEVLVGKCPDW